jgi:hypothetical protein
MSQQTNNWKITTWLKVQETQEMGSLNWVSLCLKTFSFSSKFQKL